MSTEESFEVNTARDALSLLSIKMHEKFDKEVLSEIEEVWYKLGLSIGKKMKENLPENGLAAVGQLFLDSGRKRGTKVDVLELNDQKIHIKSYRCALGLKGHGRELCKAAMGCDRGLFEAATNRQVQLKSHKTLAADDDCCEIVIETKETHNS